MTSNHSIVFEQDEPSSGQQDLVEINKNVCVEEINAILKEKKDKIATALKVCAHCTLCADSCFLYRSKEQVTEHMPSHKFITSLGVIYKKKGKVTIEELYEMRETLWKRCVLCTRCSCPLGINIPELLAIGRRILRTQGVYHSYSENQPLTEMK
ncbi:MAG: (Fe-S)-binding protein [Desulfamplus sp.]|nr:(Fe-S)-binding protein [Desulfamplus sp.]